MSDNQAGVLVANLLAGKVPRLKKITADAGYKVAFKEHAETNYAWKVEVMQKSESTTGFIPQKGRAVAGRKVFQMAQF